jgi:hypothetical protein
MIVKNESKHYIDKTYGIYMEIFSNDDLHHISVYNDKKESNVSFSVDNEGMKRLADFLNKVVQLDIAKSIMIEDSECLKKLEEK